MNSKPPKYLPRQLAGDFFQAYLDVVQGFKHSQKTINKVMFMHHFTALDFTNPHVWLSFLTLCLLEVVLGVDNVIFISIITNKLPKALQARARQIGLSAALFMRIGLLLTITWVMGLTAPLMTVFDFTLSWRDVILLGGGLFLIAKATSEIHHDVEGGDTKATHSGKAKFWPIVAQVMVLDLVFSLDSIITAVGLVDEVGIMIAAVVVSIIVMMLAAGPISGFISHHPTVKMLALAFLIMVGVALVADGMHFHIPRGYLYTAIAFSMAVECLNLLAAKKRKGAT